ncbi:MAG: PKD domain-containing protein [Cryomorphaceae bacterium]
MGEVGFCLGETVELEALNNGGYNGTWTNTDCPQPPCIAETGTPDAFEWSSAGAALGTYTMTYGGECLQTVTHTFTLLDGPVVSWIPEDDTPCLNECFSFAPEVLENFSSFGWLHEAAGEGGVLSGNELCFETIGNPEVLDICLWAELDHVVEGQPYTCRTEACHTIEPVFSPGNYPELPAFACPGETLVLDVDPALYDGCTFSLHGVADYPDCSAVTIPDGLYGDFTYEVFLYYQGCTDTLSGNLFVPQPPSATLELDYDPCVADVRADLLNVSGDLLEYSWSIYDNPGNDYGYLLDADDGNEPSPNPIPLSSLFLPTDTTFYVEVVIANVCDTLVLTDTVNFIAPPNIGIDIFGEPGGVFCLPQDLQFEIGQFATQYIDSVVWTFNSIYDYGNITDTVFYNLEWPPPFSFQNNGVSDTVHVEATAYNICGSGSDSLSFVLIPPSVYLEMPDWADGVCPGGEVTIPTLQVEGNPTSCSVSSDPLIPGLANVCHEGFDSVTVAVPTSTPPGVYTIETTVEGCGSWSDFTFLEVFAVPDVDFAMPESACTDEEIDFINLTEGATDFIWSFGSDSVQWIQSQLSFPSHSFDAPGIYGVQLIAVSAEGCTDSTFQWIDIFGPDPEIILADDALCSGDSTTATFPDQSDLISIYWEFLLPGKDTLIYTAQQSVEATFINSSTDQIDKWEVTLELEDRFGCRASGEGLVFVSPIPLAYFTHGDLEGCAQAVEIQFTNGSTPNTSSLWNFNDPQTGTNNISYQRNPTHIFSRAGQYDVMLSVENSFGCSNRFSRLLDCDHLEIYVPNAFSPDGNEINEIFKPVIHGVEYFDNGDGDYYLFEIHNRWGSRIFHTNDPDKGWDGSSPNGTHYAEPEVYQWQLMLVTPYGTERRNGHVVLLR